MFDNKKQLVLALIAVAVLSAALGTSAVSYIQSAYAQTSSKVPTDYRQYSSSTLGIKMQVPADWLYKEINNTAVTFISAPNSTNRAAVVVDVEKCRVVCS